jgi:hypothetical protein
MNFAGLTIVEKLPSMSPLASKASMPVYTGTANLTESAMTRAMSTLAAIALVCSTATATPPPDTFESPCECRDARDRARLPVKTEAHSAHHRVFDFDHPKR